MADVKREEILSLSAAAMITPPAGVCLAGLLTQIAIHFSLWGAVPLFVLAMFAGAAATIAFACKFAAHQSGWLVVPCFLGWVACSVVLAIGGLMLIALLPISVGDGP